MRIRQLLQSCLVGDRAIIEIWKKPFRFPDWEHTSKWERIAYGYKDDTEVLKFQEYDICEFYYKSYPECFDIYAK